jgi:hypothetical protein
METSFSAPTKSNRINRAAAHSPATTTHQKLNKNKKISTKAQKLNVTTTNAQIINVTTTTATKLPVICTQDQKIDATTTATPLLPANTPYLAPPTQTKGRSHK